MSYEKNNGLELTALTMKGKSNICPTIYLEPYYEKIKDGMGFEESMQKISQVYESAMKEDPQLPFDISKYEDIKDKLYVSIINAEKNTEMLSQIPHQNFADLACIYKIKMEIAPMQIGSITIDNDHLKLLGRDSRELHEMAMANMKKIMPYSFENLSDVIAGLMGIEPEEFAMNNPSEIQMWVLSNKDKYQGAAYMIDDDVLNEISEKIGGDLIIIPSSIHENLILKKDENTELGEIKRMVEEVNATQVEPEEVLSDSVYIYDRMEHRLSIADMEEPEYEMKMQGMSL